MQQNYSHCQKYKKKLPFSAVEEIVTGREKKEIYIR